MKLKLVNSTHVKNAGAEAKTVLYPSSMGVVPFAPFAINLEHPVTWMFLLFPFISFFGTPQAKLARALIIGFSKWFWILFTITLMARILISVLGSVLVMFVILLLFLIIGFYWHCQFVKVWDELLLMIES